VEKEKEIDRSEMRPIDPGRKPYYLGKRGTMERSSKITIGYLGLTGTHAAVIEGGTKGSRFRPLGSTAKAVHFVRYKKQKQSQGKGLAS